MNEEAVSLATLKQTIQKMFESLQIVKLDGNPEYEQLHRDILKWKRKSKIEVVACVEKLQKQLQEFLNWMNRREQETKQEFQHKFHGDLPRLEISVIKEKFNEFLGDEKC